jgi:CheY-like chemotaxis protein
LPCVRNERRETSAEAEDEERLPGVEVIVVDDEEGAAEAIARALRKAGAIAHEAKSVAEALRLFDRTTPQVLVSDIGLPDRDGLDLIRAVRELEEPTRSVLALAVTGFADPEARRRIQRAGYDAYLAKPVEPAVMVDRVVSLTLADRAETQQPRRILLLAEPSPETRTLRDTLEREGHPVRECHRLEALADLATAPEPHLVIACLPMAGVRAASLSRRLSATGVSAPLVGVLAPEDDTEQKPFDFVLWRPVQEDALLRLVRLGGENA